MRTTPTTTVQSICCDGNSYTAFATTITNNNTHLTPSSQEPSSFCFTSNIITISNLAAATNVAGINLIVITTVIINHRHHHYRSPH